MEIYEQSPTATPHLFNLGRDVNGEMVYDLPHIREPKADHISYRKASLKGEQELRLYQGTTELWDGGERVAEQWVIFEHWDGTAWITPQSVKTVDARENGEIIGDLTMFAGGAKLKVSSNWTAKHLAANAEKQTFTATYNNELVRVKWKIRLYDLDTIVNHDDYTGNKEIITDDSNYDYVTGAGYVDVTVIFEPLGVMNELVIDPYLSVSVPSTTFAITWPSGDIATWTLATDSAVVMENGTARSMIRDAHCNWTATAEKLIRYQHTAGTIAGMALSGTGSYLIAGNLTQVGTTDMWFYPADASTTTNKATIAAQLDDTVLTLPTSVTDYNIPKSIGTSGFTSDGAWRTGLTSHAGSFTADINRDNMSLVLVDEGIRTVKDDGSGYDEHLIFRWDCNSDTVQVGDSASVTTSGLSYASDGVRGKGVEILDTDTARVAESGWLDANGTIIFSFRETGTTADADWYLGLFSDAGSLEHFIVRHNANAIQIVEYSLATGTRTATFTGSPNPADGKQHGFMISWDKVKQSAWLQFDGTLYKTSFAAVGLSIVGTPSIAIGCHDLATSRGCDGIIDEVKIYNKAIIPNTAYYTGIGSNSSDLLAVNQAVAHSNVTLYSGDGTTLDIGTTSVTDISNITASAGSVLIDCNVGTALTADTVLFSAGSASDLTITYIHATPLIRFKYGSVTINSAAITSGMPGRRVISAHYKASSPMRLAVDGLVVTGTASTAPTLAASITWASTVGMTRKTITNDPNTPMIPTAGGKPIVLPVVTRS